MRPKTRRVVIWGLIIGVYTLLMVVGIINQWPVWTGMAWGFSAGTSIALGIAASNKHWFAEYWLNRANEAHQPAKSRIISAQMVEQRDLDARAQREADKAFMDEMEGNYVANRWWP